LCGDEAEMLRTKEMKGIGWFECECKHRYADYSAGSLASKCRECEAKNFPKFIVSPSVQDVVILDKMAHNCDLCNGVTNKESVSGCKTVQDVKDEVLKLKKKVLRFQPRRYLF
jgi:hypothetical protein